MIDFCVRARKEHYSYLIMNPNMNENEEGKIIKGSETMSKHCSTVWDSVVMKCPARNVYIIAHSAGGYCTYTLFTEYWRDFKCRVKGIALSDSFFGDVGSGSKKVFVSRVCV